MLFKMLGLERAWEFRRESMPKPRQIFVTQSRVLAGKVEEYFTKLLESLSTAGSSPKDLVKAAEAKKLLREDDVLVDVDDEPEWRSDLPSSYLQLRDEHFPLFLTFDRVCLFLFLLLYSSWCNHLSNFYPVV